MAKLDWAGARQRDKLRRAENTERPSGRLVARFTSTCEKCHAQVRPGDVIRKYLASYRHATCPRDEP